MPPAAVRPQRIAAAASAPRPWQRWFLAAAGLSFVASVAAWFTVDRAVGLFIGLWVPSILSLGAFLAAGRSAHGGVS